MKMLIPTSLAAVCALAAVAWSFARAQGDDQKKMAEMMKQAERFTKPGEHHNVLERLVGKWNTETKFFMGAESGPSEKGTSENTWLIPGRWIQMRWKGSLMNMPGEHISLIGYDNFKMSYVWTSVSSYDTAMNRGEGDMTQDGKSLICYGTLDEYLDGSHDKMVKYAWRFLDPDKFVLEVHDLVIGETNSKVLEFTYTRAK